MDKSKFEFHLKEREFRFNNRGKDMYNVLLRELRNRPLNESKPFTFITTKEFIQLSGIKPLHKRWLN